MKSYFRFGLMILTSTVVMYFLMFFNIFELSHFMFSETRVYMSIMMGSVMAIIMLLFMWKMYQKKKLNYLILGVSILIFGTSLWLVRSQATVDDTSWMKAMIPHHSIAILTSERADVSDPRVQELRDSIIKTQKEEIAEMKKLIEDIEENGEKEQK
ncbi:DUF305 domain-containing protein [Carnobacterium inhibens]|uniref:DUF305 domain-containing protein n=1 Tax=Carnobacterium inhibens subsp. gilichinskyi TaxID=1266845 RepID=U5SBZ8_9LACT|nr:DUF305 domain-containing protein [Carnobacterium inhibens]AGY82581.1 hypothetical protein Q783_10475 [Carnobacterium inhibens subsp. gilichinskyi]